MNAYYLNNNNLLLLLSTKKMLANSGRELVQFTILNRIFIWV